MVVREYEEELVKCRQQITLQEYIGKRQCNLDDKDRYKIAIRLGNEWHKKTLDDLERMTSAFADKFSLLRLVPKLHGLDPGSITVIFCLPKSVKLNHDQLLKFFQPYNPLQVMVDGVSIYDVGSQENLITDNIVQRTKGESNSEEVSAIAEKMENLGVITTMDVTSVMQCNESLDLVSRVTRCLNESISQAAQSELQILRESILTALEELNKREEKLEKEQKDLISKEADLKHQIDDKEVAIRNSSSTADSTKDITVEIGMETFSLVEFPARTTALVLDEKDRLLEHLDLETLVTDLRRVGKLVRIAYNGLASSTELQIKIRQVGYHITNLYITSAATIEKFQQGSKSVLADLKTTYQLLLQGNESIALVALQSITTITRDMAAAAEVLHKEFEEEPKRVEKVWGETQTKSDEMKRKKELKEEGRQLEIQKLKAVEKKRAAEEVFHFYEEKYKAAEKKQELFKVSASSETKQLVNFCCRVFTLGMVRPYDIEGNSQRAQTASEEKMKHLKEMQKMQQARSAALEDIAEFARRIENCKDDSELAQVAINALHEAVGGLKKLSMLMLKASLFWRQMQEHCQELQQDKVQEIMDEVMKKPPNACIEVWTGRAFKTMAITYYAKWVALDDVCSKYMGQIQETQKDFYSYLEENPTLEESRRYVRELAKLFGEELKIEQKAIADKEFATSEEIKKLKLKDQNEQSQD